MAVAYSGRWKNSILGVMVFIHIGQTVFFAKLVDDLLVKSGNNGALVGNATTYILGARELFNFALPMMKAVAADSSAAATLMERSKTEPS